MGKVSRLRIEFHVHKQTDYGSWKFARFCFLFGEIVFENLNLNFFLHQQTFQRVKLQIFGEFIFCSVEIFFDFCLYFRGKGKWLSFSVPNWRDH